MRYQKPLYNRIQATKHIKLRSNKKKKNSREKNKIARCVIFSTTQYHTLFSLKMFCTSFCKSYKTNTNYFLCNCHTMVCPLVRGDNPRALASKLSPVQAEKPWYYKYLSWVYGVDRKICHEGH